MFLVTKNDQYLGDGFWTPHPEHAICFSMEVLARLRAVRERAEVHEIQEKKDTVATFPQPRKKTKLWASITEWIYCNDGVTAGQVIEHFNLPRHDRAYGRLQAMTQNGELETVGYGKKRLYRRPNVRQQTI